MWCTCTYFKGCNTSQFEPRISLIRVNNLDTWQHLIRYIIWGYFQSMHYYTDKVVDVYNDNNNWSMTQIAMYINIKKVVKQLINGVYLKDDGLEGHSGAYFSRG